METMNKVTEVRDSYFVTYGVFYSMGVLTFVPYFFCILATDYWMFKFRDPSRGGPVQPDRPTPPPIPPDDFEDFAFLVDGAEDSGRARDRTQLQASFTSSFSITYQVSLLGFLVVTALFRKKLPPPSKRIKAALFSMLVLFLIHTAFTKINTDSFQEAFFAIAMILAVLLNLSSAIIMVSLFELVINFPIGYYGTILSGQAICGVVSAIVQICVQSIRLHYLTSALIYFMVGSVIILATTIFYLITKQKSKYFIYRIGQYEDTTQHPVDKKFSFNMDKLKGALQSTKWFLGAMVFVQGSTAMVHPGLAALIVSVERDSGGGDQWNEIYFVPVVTFLGFHACDLIGREVARKIQRPRNAFVILALASLRLVLVPLLMLCNAQPRRHMPVMFGDNQYMIFIYMFALSQGYLVNLCIISVPRVAKKEELEFVTVLLPLFSVLSVAICSTFNLVIISLI
ncbi:equilibrative nucleoside transporter 1 [Anoplophora glabripennis]|nr:equilibrative nucleoside transporter 1 [Anoplophora glabripennis]